MAIKRQAGAFINARYSTDNQNPDSIEVQVEKCTEWCHKNNIPILGIFSDEATSGMKDTRPQYEAMMQQLRMGIADTVVIYDQSRMFRKMTAWFSFRDELSAMGVRVVSVTQPMIGKDLRDPTNFLTEGSMALFNQIWALQSRQKTMEKMRFMARNGQHTGGKPALGYVVKDGRLAICEEEAETVRRIFREYASGMTYRQIIEGLNTDGIKTKRGNTFGSNSLHDLLHNEKYIGVLTYGAMPYREDGTRNTHSKDGTDVIRVEDAIPPIIEKELFDKVQKIMAGHKRPNNGRPPQNREYPLRGKVYCAECKSAMTISIDVVRDLPGDPKWQAPHQTHDYPAGGRTDQAFPGTHTMRCSTAEHPQNSRGQANNGNGNAKSQNCHMLHGDQADRQCRKHEYRFNEQGLGDKTPHHFIVHSPASLTRRYH